MIHNVRFYYVPMDRCEDFCWFFKFKNIYKHYYIRVFGVEVHFHV